MAARDERGYWPGRPCYDSGDEDVRQVDLMRELYRANGGDEAAIVRAYAAAERSGKVVRKSNENGLSAEQYGKRLLMDGPRKGWL